MPGAHTKKNTFEKFNLESSEHSEEKKRFCFFFDSSCKKNVWETERIEHHGFFCNFRTTARQTFSQSFNFVLIKYSSRIYSDLSISRSVKQLTSVFNRGRNTLDISRQKESYTHVNSAMNEEQRVTLELFAISSVSGRIVSSTACSLISLLACTRAWRYRLLDELSSEFRKWNTIAICFIFRNRIQFTKSVQGMDFFTLIPFLKPRSRIIPDQQTGKFSCIRK